jgi:hypothetical protein
MATTHDWLPQNHEALYDQSNLTFNYLMEPDNRDRFGFTPSSPQGQWFDKSAVPGWTRFSSAFTDWLDPAHRTPGKTVTLLDAEKAFKPVYRVLFKGFLRDNPLVTGLDLTNMGLPQRSSGERHPSKVADTAPWIHAWAVGPRQVGFNFGSGKDSPAKFEGQHGLELITVIADTKPAELTDLIHSAFDTHSPLIQTFNESDRGKILWYAGRWENKTGHKGPWSEIMSIVIP